jgi:hypothetical protein
MGVSHADTTFPHLKIWKLTRFCCSIAYMINENSIQFNIVSKGLGSERMSFYLNEAAGDIRDIMMPELEGPKAKL